HLRPTSVHASDADVGRGDQHPLSPGIVRGSRHASPDGLRVTIETTRTAEDVVARVRAACPDADLVFVFGAGCCEGTAPHLFAGYALTPEHARVGTAGGVGGFAHAHVRRPYAEQRGGLGPRAVPPAGRFPAEVPPAW